MVCPLLSHRESGDKMAVVCACVFVCVCVHSEPPQTVLGPQQLQTPSLFLNRWMACYNWAKLKILFFMLSLACLLHLTLVFNLLRLYSYLHNVSQNHVKLGQWRKCVCHTFKDAAGQMWLPMTSSGLRLGGAPRIHLGPCGQTGGGLGL